MFNCLKFGEKYDGKTVVALGYFDCLHTGHKKIISEAKNIAQTFGAKAFLFTFDSSPATGNRKSEGSVLTFKERIVKAEESGLDGVVFAKFDEEFKNTDAGAFIDRLTESLSPVALVCGFDYTFGRGAAGNAELLRNICREKGIVFKVVEKVEASGEKVSTGRIKKLLIKGDIALANEMLGYSYFLTGKVVEGRQIGRTMGFPTANVAFPTEKYPLKEGVYKTRTKACGKIYDSLTNIGGRPTFGLSALTTETYIKDFSDNLYGKEITVYFDGYIRPVVKFESVKALEEQITKDLESLKK
ncbi:MAG: riboflavin biosynthesis protein RibF [Clostridia bacterium]|nr:riboflavin biosynthesis protein RibF [Clostridia bacterium]